jgi:flagellar biosynthesis protein FlhG
MPPIDVSSLALPGTRARFDAPSDQADGLRRMFGGGQAVLVPVVANPHVGHQAALLARVADAFAAQGLNTLVVDAADTAPEPGEIAFLDLAACVEPLAPKLAYLAARGLPMQSVDTHGSCARFVPKMMDLVPGVDVVVLHAETRVLCRMLGGREARPVLLGSAETDSLTHAYAALKMLSQRLGLMSFDLVLPAMPAATPGVARPDPRAALTRSSSPVRPPVSTPVHRTGPTSKQVADRVADCADRFLGAALHDWAAVDPLARFGQPAGADLLRLAAGQLDLAGWTAVARRPFASHAVRENVRNAPLFA